MLFFIYGTCSSSPAVDWRRERRREEGVSRWIVLDIELFSDILRQHMLFHLRNRFEVQVICRELLEDESLDVLPGVFFVMFSELIVPHRSWMFIVAVELCLPIG